MTDIEQLDATELQQFNEFKRNINRQAAQAQVTKLEYDLIDASLEKSALKRACQEANNLQLGAICVLPCFARTCASLLGSDPQTSLIACISFPHGCDTTEAKTAAVKYAVKDGVDEVEVTAPTAFVKDGNWGYVKREFRKLKKAAKKRGVRINIQGSLYSTQEIIKLCTAAVECGITSLRVSSDGCGAPFKPEIIATIKNAVKDRCTIKADGVASLSEMNSAVNMGAGIIGSNNAPDLARLIFRAAEV